MTSKAKFKPIAVLACMIMVIFALFCIGILCFAQMMTNDRVVELPYVGGFRLLP